ncbi:MAG TPA: tetratricopeptide repeat protein [Steroidobacteraceae bacterium]|nr:tetratricopeptide repeat protein [Steroidobacteraceae bacterium]
MRVQTMLLTTLSMFAAGLGLAAMPGGGGSNMNMGSMNMPSQSPQERAAAAYNSGVNNVKRADALDAAAAQETDAKKHDKALKKAHYAYVDARRDFEDATHASPNLPEAWNALGYTQRKLGEYDASLKSYDRALALRPGFPEALEYRGEAYLGLNRVEDAKQVYLDLFATNRALSDQLMQAIKTWIDVQRKSSGSHDTATVDGLDKWVQERSQIAAQTAALTRAGAPASWH